MHFPILLAHPLSQGIVSINLNPPHNVIDFLNNNSGAIQAIFVFVLVSVTIWYAISTKKMAKIMARQYASANRPYLYPAREVDRNFDPNNKHTIQLVFHFTNVGNVAVKYLVDELTLEHTSINPQKVNTILFPQQKGVVYSNLFQSQADIGQGDGLQGRIKIIFWASDMPRPKYYFERHFTLAPQLVTFSNSEDFGELTVS